MFARCFGDVEIWVAVAAGGFGSLGLELLGLLHHIDSMMENFYWGGAGNAEMELRREGAIEKSIAEIKKYTYNIYDTFDHLTNYLTCADSEVTELTN